MQIKISHHNPVVVQDILTGILNLATVFALAGKLPTNHDIENPQSTGCYWYREVNRYQLAGITNNWWGFVKSEDQHSIVLEFRYRHDKDNICDLFAQLISLRFDNVKIIEP